MKRIFILGLLALLLTGCVAVRPPAERIPPKLEPALALKFTDIPVPAKFKYLSNESYVFQSKDMRIGMLKYKGKATADQIIQFYREQMPAYGWQLLNSFEFGQKIFNFEKKNESCIVYIEENTGIIVISFGPKAKELLNILDKFVK